ncbi:MAG TPA: aldehyde dehydrogenase family protein [Pyrinomonadaceae bacterium]
MGEQIEAKRLLINGNWRESSENFEVRSPFSGETLARVCKAGEDEIEETIASAARAAAEMRELARSEVYEGLSRIAAGIKERRDEFACTIALEAAKPITAARGEVERSIGTFEMAAAEARTFTGEVVPVDAQALGKNRFAWTERVPRGIIFWNYSV